MTKIKPKLKLKSLNGFEIDSQIVFIEALRWIKNQAIQIIKDHNQEIKGKKFKLKLFFNQYPMFLVF